MESPILSQLIQLLRGLYEDTQGFLECQDDPQLWYNRGYANGMVLAMRSLGHGDALPPELALDPDGEVWGQIAQQALTPWGRAHAHGLEMGRNETIEVLEAA
ncbi:MAG: hypothetical protein ACM3ST_00905 [Bdellovibrio bacteriovorus]